MTPQQLYAKLELIPADQFPLDRPKLHHFGSQLQRLKQQASHRLQSVFSYFCGSREPRIKQVYDRHQNPYFQVYDPMNHQTYHFPTETEVRAWLERRYYLP